MRGKFTTYEAAFTEAMRLKYPPLGLGRRLPMTCEIRHVDGFYILMEVAS